MALALLANTSPRLIQLLNANRGSYSSSIGTGATGIGAYPFQQEIVDAQIEADGLLITQGYFQTAKSPLRNRFLTQSANLADGDKLPEFDGLIGKCEWSSNGSAWRASDLAKSKADVTEARQNGSYVGAAAFYGLHWFDEQEGYIFHTSPFFRLFYPSYTKTAVLQANENHVPAIIAGALMLLYKDSSNAMHEFYTNLWEAMLARVVSSGALRLGKVSALPMDLRG